MHLLGEKASVEDLAKYYQNYLAPNIYERAYKNGYLMPN
jgi:hypothetical protein